MKFKYDYGEVEFPAIALKKAQELFEKAKKEEPKETRGNLKDFIENQLWEMDEWGDFEETYYKKIAPKEIALFLIDEAHMTDYGQGGWWVEEDMEFIMNGNKYIICCFGWFTDENSVLRMIGYKDNEIKPLIMESKLLEATTI